MIIIIQDSTGNYKGSPFEEFINISGKGADGNGMPFATIYKNTDIVEAYDPASVIEQNKKFLGISMPPFSPKLNTPAAIHHKLGVQCVMMKYNLIDAQMLAYRNFFMNRGTAFRLKPDHLRYFDNKNSKPKTTEKRIIIWSKTGFYAWRLLQSISINLVKLIYIFLTIYINNVL